MVGPLEVPEKFSVVGGGLLDFKVYLSPLLGEGVRSRIERCSREGSRDVKRGFREREREGRVREGEGRGERGEERDCDNRRVKLLNHANKPCNENLDYSMTVCMADYFNKVTFG